MLSQSESRAYCTYSNDMSPEDIIIRFIVNQESKQMHPDDHFYLQKLVNDLQAFNLHGFIVEHFISKNKHQLLHKRPTAQNIIAYINNQQYITDRTRPSDSVKNEILKRLRIK